MDEMDVQPGLPKIYLPKKEKKKTLNQLISPPALHTTVANTLSPFNLFENAI